ncbi:MAG: RNA polymerase sigma factor [Bacteroidales bacterium]|nr:RNA polymerase sigma factor [Bacteroidales bacterium]
MSKNGDIYYIEKVLNGKRQAFSVLVENHQDKVFSLALKICGNAEDAEEVAQDSFMKAFRSLGSFKGKSSFGTWLYRITYNTAISCVRKKNYNVLNIEDFPADASDFLQNNESETLAEMEYKRSLLAFAMQKLNIEDRAIISMYYFQELNLNEIVEITKMTNSNLKVRLHRARKKLEETISNNYSQKEEAHEKVRI